MNIDEIKQEVQEVVTSKQGVENSITPEGLGGLLSDICDFAAQAPSSSTFSDIVVENTATVKKISGQTVVSETISGGSLLSYFISGSTVSGRTIVGNTVAGNTISGGTIRGNIISGNSVYAGSINATSIGGKTVSNLITGSGTSNCLAKFDSVSGITNGPQFRGNTNEFLNNAGDWVTPDALSYSSSSTIKVDNTSSPRTISARGYYYDTANCSSTMTLFSNGGYYNTNLRYNGYYSLPDQTTIKVTGTLNGELNIGDTIVIHTHVYTIRANGLSSSPSRLTLVEEVSSDVTPGDIIYKVGNSATGKNSFAAGYGTIANQDTMMAIGKFNETGEAGELFTIGNGNTDSRRKTCFKVVAKNDSDRTCDAYVKGNLNVTNSISTSGTVVSKGNISTSGSVVANVNEVANVELGLPIGSIIMWAGATAPEGWLLCDGKFIPTNQNHTKTANPRGTSVDYGKYQELLNILGSTYDIGGNPMDTVTSVDGESFSGYRIALPDLQQRFPLGAKNDTSWQCGNQTYNTSLGKTGGKKEHTLSISEMPKHTHNFISEWTADEINNHSTCKHADNSYTTSTTEYDDTLNNKTNLNGIRTSEAPWDVGRARGIVGKTIHNTEGNDIIRQTGGSLSHNNIPFYLAINFIIKYK